MSIDYASIRAEAAAVITEAGQPGFLRRTAAGSGTEFWDTGQGVVTNYPVTFVLTNYNARDRDGTLVRVNDQLALISAQGLSIDASDADQLVDSQGKVWEIVNIQPLAPGGVTLLYQAQVRR